MKQLQRQKENKSGILEDMLSFITYTPNRETDILAFMERYQKSDHEQRPAILEHLRHCMDGKPYPNPYAGGYRYTREDVAKVEAVLDEYIDNLALVQGDPDAISECMEDTARRLNELNEAAGGALIDPWRGERLRGLIHSAAELAGLAPEADHVLRHQMW